MPTSLRTEKITPDLINTISERIVAAFNPQSVMLFGSYAEGDQKADSDLDFFVVNDTKQTNRDLRRGIDRLMDGRLFAMDIVVRTPAEVARNLKAKNPFYLNLFKTAKVLHDKGK